MWVTLIRNNHAVLEVKGSIKFRKYELSMPPDNTFCWEKKQKNRKRNKSAKFFIAALGRPLPPSNHNALFGKSHTLGLQCLQYQVARTSKNKTKNVQKRLLGSCIHFTCRKGHTAWYYIRCSYLFCWGKAGALAICKTFFDSHKYSQGPVEPPTRAACNLYTLLITHLHPS